MAKRGLEKTMCLGMASDVWGNKEEMTTLQEVSGDLPWINQTHGGSHVGTKLAGVSPVAYTAYVWNVRYAEDPNKARTYGWKRPELYAEFRRFGSLNDWPLSTILLFPELQITGQQRGVGRVGADFWPVLRNKQGKRAGWIWSPYLQSMWHSCQLMSHMLTPGPAGPVASSRYELMREGILPGSSGPFPGSSVPLPGRSVPLPGSSGPFPGRVVPVPGRSVPLPGASVPLRGRSVPLPGSVFPPPD